MSGISRRTFMEAVGTGALGMLAAPGFSMASTGSSYESGLSLLAMGEVMPQGWIKEQLRRDLDEGITGGYDRITNTVSRDLFGSHKVSSGGPLIPIVNWPSWWSGEHEGYWKDAVTRTAFLVKNDEYMGKVRGWMERILECQSRDGYIGIYQPDNRYNHQGENGELWTQSRIMVAMLAYHEFTREKSVLEAVEKAVDLTMSRYGPGRSYFQNARSRLLAGGLSHGLAFMDVLEWLYRKSGEEEYKRFAEFLYQDFSKYCQCNNDMALHKLLDRERKFYLHGAHICEHFMVPFFLAQITGKEKYHRAAKNAMHKLRYHLTPSRALVSYEDVNGDRGSAGSLYEYCCITEMAISLVRVAQMKGSVEAADLIEKMTFNAGQGARLPVLKACSYLTRDNRSHINSMGHLSREGYRPTHIAACCTLNAGRLMPYYVEGMWMRKAPDGLAAMLYGPCRVETRVNGVKLKIEEKTSYPFSDDIDFMIEPQRTTTFSLLLRIPEFADDMVVEGVPKEAVKRVGHFIEVRKQWRKGNCLRARMVNSIRQVPDAKAPGGAKTEYFIERGPLLFGLHLPEKILPMIEHKNSGFYNYEIIPKSREGWNYRLKKEAEFELVRNRNADLLRPWDSPVVHLAGHMAAKNTKTVEAKLEPEGNTILRRVSFPRR